MAVAELPEMLIEYVPDVILPEKSPADKLAAVKPEIAVFITADTLPWASVVSTGINDDEPYVPLVPTFFRVNAPELSIVASLLKPFVSHCVPFPMRRLPEVAVVVPRTAPLIFATVVDPCVPVTSPINDPLKLVADVTLPVISIEYVPPVILLE